MDLWSYIKEHMMRAPSQTICDGEATLTYEEMLIAAESLGNTLKGQPCCAIYCKSELLTAMVILGCFSAQVTAIPLSFRYGSNHCNKILKFISPSCVITDVEGKPGIYDVLDSEYTPPKENTAVIMHTSGTSGSPKGIMLGEESIMTNVRDILSYFPINRQDAILISRPLYHCAVLTGEFLAALIKGCKIVFSSDPYNPKTLLHLIQKHQITVFGGTPTLLEALSFFVRDIRDISIKRIVVSGECLSVAVAKRIREGFPNTKIHHVYGLTEASPRISQLPPEAFDTHPDCVGYPLNSVEIKILDESGTTLSAEQQGTLWVRGNNIMHGYYNNQKLTNSVLKNGWLCTGDCALITKDGFLKIRGRSDDMIIRAGMNIYPQEIEAELKKDSRTKEVLVQGIHKEIGGTQIAMKIVGDFRSTDEVRKLCIKNLPPYEVPGKIEIVKFIPKNATGKIIRGKRNA